MSLSDVIKAVVEGFTGEAVKGAVQGIKTEVEETTKRVIKASTLFLMFALAILFVLIGLAQFLEARYLWTDGLGLIAVGALLLVLGIVSKALR